MLPFVKKTKKNKKKKKQTNKPKQTLNSILNKWTLPTWFFIYVNFIPIFLIYVEITELVFGDTLSHLCDHQTERPLGLMTAKARNSYQVTVIVSAILT